MEEAEKRGASDEKTFEREYKSANYLLVAHGTGLLACLTLLKDYKDTPYLKGIGTFITLFGLGLVFAATSYSTLDVVRTILMEGLLFTRLRSAATKTMRMAYLWVGSQLVSYVLLLVAVFLLIYRLGEL
jgi:hypothetical protein